MARIRELATVTQGLSLSGRGLGARRGGLDLCIVESGNVTEDGWLALGDLREIKVVNGVRIERHLLRPYDVVVTARAEKVQVALVPPRISRTVAGVTLLVVKPVIESSGLGHYLWYFLTSKLGQSQISRRLTVSNTVVSLSAASLGDIELPQPSSRTLDAVAGIVEASELAYQSAVDAARVRRDILRDAIIGEIQSDSSPFN